MESHSNVSNNYVLFIYMVFNFFSNRHRYVFSYSASNSSWLDEGEVFHFPRQFWFSKCWWNPSSDNICRVFPVLFKKDKKVHLRYEKLPIVAVIVFFFKLFFLILKQRFIKQWNNDETTNKTICRYFLMFTLTIANDHPSVMIIYIMIIVSNRCVIRSEDKVKRAYFLP